jgi:hypothetical protein
LDTTIFLNLLPSDRFEEIMAAAVGGATGAAEKAKAGAK